MNLQTVEAIIATSMTIGGYKTIEYMWFRLIKNQPVDSVDAVRQCLENYDELKKDYNELSKKLLTDANNLTQLEDNHRKLHQAFLAQIRENDELKRENSKLKGRIQKLENILTSAFGEMWLQIDEDTIDWDKLHNIINDFIIKSKLIHNEVKE